MAENARPQSAMELALLKQTTADRAIHVQVQQYIAETVSQLGGWSGIQAGDLAMLLSQKICLTFALALEAEVVASGRLSDDKGRPSALLAQLRAFQGEFRQNQVALGLARARITSRRPKDLNPRMEDILEEYRVRADETKAQRKTM